MDELSLCVPFTHWLLLIPCIMWHFPSFFSILAACVTLGGPLSVFPVTPRCLFRKYRPRYCSLYYCVERGASEGQACPRVCEVFLGGPAALTFSFMTWWTCCDASESPLAAVVSSCKEASGALWSKQKCEICLFLVRAAPESFPYLSVRLRCVSLVFPHRSHSHLVQRLRAPVSQSHNSWKWFHDKIYAADLSVGKRKSVKSKVKQRDPVWGEVNRWTCLIWCATVPMVLYKQIVYSIIYMSPYPLYTLSTQLQIQTSQVHFLKSHILKWHMTNMMKTFVRYIKRS